MESCKTSGIFHCRSMFCRAIVTECMLLYIMDEVFKWFESDVVLCDVRILCRRCSNSLYLIGHCEVSWYVNNNNYHTLSDLIKKMERVPKIIA